MKKNNSPKLLIGLTALIVISGLFPITLFAASARPSISFFKGPAKAEAGKRVTLTWKTQNAESVTINPDIGNVPTDKLDDGFGYVFPAKNTIYEMIAKNSVGIAKRKVIIRVKGLKPPPRIFEFTTLKDEVAVGERVRLQWKTQGATAIIILPDIGDVGKNNLKNGFRYVYPKEDTIYEIIVANDRGVVKGTTGIKVTPKDE